MSWWGGGDISSTPGVEYRIFAMYSLILKPGNCPPSPGFDPWAILICNISELTKYSVVTPKRPLATCFMELRRSSWNRSGSSPPSPVFDFPPIWFMASANVSCDSLEMEPSDIAPVEKRLTISRAGSTSSNGIGSSSNPNSPRNVACRALSSSKCLVYSLNVSKLSFLTARCNETMLSVFHWWYWPCARSWYSPPISSSSGPSSTPPNARQWRSKTSRPSSSSPTPPMREAVPVKYRSMTPLSRPTASNIWAPEYENNVEIPILEMTLSKPLFMALA